MSVAFTKEESAETASETLLPDRPVSPHPNLVTGAGLKALEAQLEQAREAYAAARKIDVRHRARNRYRMAEMSVPACPIPIQNTKLVM